MKQPWRRKHKVALRWWVELFHMNGAHLESHKQSRDFRLALAIHKRCPQLEFSKLLPLCIELKKACTKGD